MILDIFLPEAPIQRVGEKNEKVGKRDDITW